MKTVTKENKVTYIIDEEAKTVKAIIKGTANDVINTLNKKFPGVFISDELFISNSFSATARCSEKDVFDVEKGKEIDRKKAILKYNKVRTKKFLELLKCVDNIADSLEELAVFSTQKCDRMENEISKY